MTLRVGIDDTDSPRGGCTTHVLTEVVRVAGEHGLDLIGEPRLVRLNPNIPWKTRGNAALSARFGRGVGRARAIGEIGGRAVRSFAAGRAAPYNVTDPFLEDAWAAVVRSSRPEEPGTDPALVATRGPLPARLYWDAVREVVPVDSIRHELARAGAWTRTRGSDRGLVGASAAIAWPGRRATWEAISYRGPARYGQPREVDRESVRRAQRAERALFLCLDARTRRLMVAPHTPCPILYGLRGTSARAPLRARRLVRSEPVDRWLLFRTNQGTGDHLRPRTADAWGEYRSGWLVGDVCAPGESLPGGHVRFSLAPARGPPIECVAFEPTKTLPRLARLLEPGDRVRVWGSRTQRPTIQLEGVEVLRWNPRRSRALPPYCASCRRRGHSLGRDRGYGCRSCARRWPPEAAARPLRSPPARLGTYHPTPSARRHLAPLGPEG